MQGLAIRKQYGRKKIMISKSRNKSIFVSVPTLKDSDYANTIYSIYETAQFPERVFVGTPVYLAKQEEIDVPEEEKFWKVKNVKNLRQEFYIWNDFAGVAKGRLNALNLYKGEDYYFQTDSHMLFAPNWDTDIIEEYESCQKYFGPKRILGTYAPGWQVLDNQIDRKFLPKYSYYQFNNIEYVGSETPFPTPADIDIDPEKDLYKNALGGHWQPARKLAAHFTFTEARPWVTNYNLCLDPNIWFWGEEFYQSALAWMRGYEFVWTKNVYVWHKYTNSVGVGLNEGGGLEKKFESKPRKIDKDDSLNYDGKGRPSYDDLKLEEKAIESLFKLDNYFSFLPRSVQGYCQYAGLDMIQKKSKPGIWQPDFLPYNERRK